MNSFDKVECPLLVYRRYVVVPFVAQEQYILTANINSMRPRHKPTDPIQSTPIADTKGRQKQAVESQKRRMSFKNVQIRYTVVLAGKRSFLIRYTIVLAGKQDRPTSLVRRGHCSLTLSFPEHFRSMCDAVVASSQD